jgi:hypothetical protein
LRGSLKIKLSKLIVKLKSNDICTAGETDPDGQGVQSVAPAAEKVSIGQAVQPEPLTSLKVPAEQGEHSVDP